VAEQLRKYTYALYLPQLSDVIARLTESTTSSATASSSGRVAGSKSRGGTPGSRPGSSRLQQTPQRSSTRNKLFGLRGPLESGRTQRTVEVQEQPMLDLTATTAQALTEPRDQAKLASRVVNLMRGAPAPRKLAKNDKNAVLVEKAGRDPFFMGGGGGSGGEDGGMGYFQWPGYLRGAFEGSRLCVSVGKPVLAPGQVPIANAGDLVHVHFEDVERQKRLWLELPGLQGGQGTSSVAQRTQSFPLLSFPAVVSLLDHLGVDVAWYARELAERLSDKLKEHSLRDGGGSGGFGGATSAAVALEKLQALVANFFSLDEQYIATRGKALHKARDIADQAPKDWSSVHVRRILSRKELVSAEEYYRMQVSKSVSQRVSQAVTQSVSQSRAGRGWLFVGGVGPASAREHGMSIGLRASV
jgi:hypothetical protein